MFTQTSQNHVLILTMEIATFDTKVAASFKRSVIDLLAQNESSSIILDLHKVHSIDSTGLGAFLYLHRMLIFREGELMLVNMTKPVYTMLELLSMHKIIPNFNSLYDAVKSTQPATRES